MSLKTQLQDYIKRKQAQYQRGLQITEQMKAERQRKKLMASRFYEPGTLHYGLHHHQSIGDFMQDAYTRRKEQRESKENRD